MPRVGAILLLKQDRSIRDKLGEVLCDEGYAFSTFRVVASSRALPPALILLAAAMPAEPVVTVLDDALRA
jgi:DNA-binding response OmpR family regulator